MGQRGNSVTHELAAWASSLSVDDLPADVKEKIGLHFADTMGVMVAGAREAPVQALGRTSAKITRGGSEPAVSLSWELPLGDSAFYHSAAAHALDFDDTHGVSIIHASSVVAPTAMVVGAAMKASGPQILAAMAAAYEVYLRLGMVVEHGLFSSRGYHPTGLFGPFAAAIITSRLLGLEEGQLAHALGIAASQAAGLQQFSDPAEGYSETKKFHPGWAAHAGVYAAFAAGEGFKAPDYVLEGRYNLYKTHVGRDPDREIFTRGLGTRWEVLDLLPKVFPCCQGNQGYMDDVMAIRLEHDIEPDMVQRITAIVTPLHAQLECEPIEIKRRPPTVYASRFSLPYCVGVAMATGDGGRSEFTENRRTDPTIMDMIDKVEFVIDPEFAEQSEPEASWTIVELADGRVMDRRSLYAFGGTGRPVSVDRYKAKFVELASEFVPWEPAETLWTTTCNLAHLESVDDLLSKYCGKRDPAMARKDWSAIF